MPTQRSSARAYGVCIDHASVLLVRAARGDDAPELWWLPGGGIDFGESATEAVEREFIEETGVRVDQVVLQDVLSDVRTRLNGEEIHTIRIIYRVRALSRDITHEQDGTTNLARWVPLNELPNYNLAPYAQASIQRALDEESGS
jgi:ADP-ribose pyrophosphatase YjhB (NUDIX family)